MDPLESVGRGLGSCFPRACGDGPRSRSRPRRPRSFPPRLRGWTRRRQVVLARRAVSPALAGMDPRSRPWRLPARGFPRACGDGPGLGRSVSRRRQFPPRLRGWTRLGVGAVEAAWVSPALAGMDPRPRPWRLPPRGFPRACGDGPAARARGPAGSSFPPRLRGWTRSLPVDLPHGLVSPALAGMDPGSRSARRRGLRFPRACGDGPAAPIPRLEASAFPPRLRGWTRNRRYRGKRLCVSPALAGMDPTGTMVRKVSKRFPRACGDGPRQGAFATAAEAFPPRLRGWTCSK